MCSGWWGSSWVRGLCGPPEQREKHACCKDRIVPYTLKPADAYDIDIEDTSYLSEHVDTGDRWVINFGPQHPATHTTLRLVLELDGERVARVTPHIGYLHSGFEKLGEVLDYNQYVTIVSRMDYLSPISCDICWHLAVERLFGIDLTPRCKVVRTILAELGRIQNHLLCVGAMALDLGAITGFLYAFNPREKIYDICDLISGQRFHPDWTRVGGAMSDLPDEALFKRMVDDFINDDLPGRSRIWRSWCCGTGSSWIGRWASV